ncbi:MAG: type I pullulanase [Erysipelotrichaceae bacterium]|nr:type I pullulanase [Erysipelotrichaceae bacterium]
MLTNIKSNLEAFLDKKNFIVIKTDKKSSFTINDDFLSAECVFCQNNLCFYHAYYNVDVNNQYVIKDEYGQSCILQIRYFVKDDEFDKLFYYDKDDLGATYSIEKTTFKLWAPIASQVSLHYQIGDIEKEVIMEKKERGVFEVSVYENLENALYYYKVNNNGVINDCLDPYSYSFNANSKKSAVINLNKIKEVDNSSFLKEFKNINDAIIYELSVRDFSMDGSLGEDVKGKFSSFLKHDVYTANHHKIGIDYLVELGITHVQLMPIIDFATVNEENIFEKYNWGYDPLGFNVIEGSYSSNPSDPYARINEAKQMIEEFHKYNIRVVLDIVFNHTYSFIDSIYNKIVPNYYYLMDENGKLSNGSFCGNDIDSTRKMVYKYLLDMCIRLVKLYNVDGFRFDLMGILSKDLIMDIYDKCKKINPSFIIYGEGWDMPSMLPQDKRANLNHANQMPQIAFFNDYFRDVMAGKTFNNYSYNQGFLTGNFSLYLDFIKAMRGSIEQNCYFNSPTSSINYIECHDNYTLYDKLKIIMPDCGEKERNKAQLTCIAAILFAQGIPFLHAGMEFNRSKKGVENSYNSSDDINMIRWNLLDENEKNVKAVKDFISIRKEFMCFKNTNRKVILNSIDAKIVNETFLILYTSGLKIVLLIFNPTSVRKKVSLNGEYYIYANQYGYLKKDDVTHSKVEVSAYGFLMLVK